MRNGCPFLSLGEALKRFSFSCILPILLAACMSTSTKMPIQGLEATAAQARKGDYKNATYLIEGQFVTLVDGFFEIESAPGSATRITTRYFGNEAFSDLNGDGMEDVAFLLTQSSGGSGTFFYVVAAEQTETAYLGTNAVSLGDRIAPQTTSIENGIITVNYADRYPGEPFTVQPSLGVSKYLRVIDNVLIEVRKP